MPPEPGEGWAQECQWRCCAPQSQQSAMDLVRCWPAKMLTPADVQVNIVFAGHDHIYERTCPVFRYCPCLQQISSTSLTVADSWAGRAAGPAWSKADTPSQTLSHRMGYHSAAFPAYRFQHQHSMHAVSIPLQLACAAQNAPCLDQPGLLDQPQWSMLGDALLQPPAPGSPCAALCRQTCMTNNKDGSQGGPMYVVIGNAGVCL